LLLSLFHYLLCLELKLVKIFVFGVATFAGLGGAGFERFTLFVKERRLLLLGCTCVFHGFLSLLIRFYGQRSDRLGHQLLDRAMKHIHIFSIVVEMAGWLFLRTMLRGVDAASLVVERLV
jgi:hypothetical protein